MRKKSPARRLPSSIVPAGLPHVTGGVARAGSLNSDPSDANRLIERHDLPGNQG